MTGNTKNPWWKVDLLQDEHVSEVYIVNRGSECGCPDRFKNFEIRVGMLFTILSLCDRNIYLNNLNNLNLIGKKTYTCNSIQPLRLPKEYGW